MASLLVVIPDRLSELARKGELSPRYYNPGEVFDDVHLLLINDDRIDLGVVQPLVGRARLTLHNLPPPSFLGTLGWRPARLRGWADQAVRLAAELRPDVVRCYAPWLNAVAGTAIKRALGVPMVLSLHINPDDIRAGLTWAQPRAKVFWWASRAIERAVMPEADVVLPVYEPARRFAERLGATRVEVVYNAVNADHLVPKGDYGLAKPPRIICVGRQIESKNPEHVIRAAARLGASLTLVGTGPLAPALRRVAVDVGATATFIDAMPNNELCASLASFDIFAAHSEYWEISKATIEALLAGLPVVLNRRRGEPVPELQGGVCVLVEDSTAGYADALRRLFADERARRTLGQHGRSVAEHRFNPQAMEQRVAELYAALIKRSQARSATR